MSDYEKVAENLVRHSGGKIYLRAKVGGKSIRLALKTTDLRIAKLKRDTHLAALRTSAALATDDVNIKKLGDAIDLVAARIAAKPNIEPRSQEYYVEIIQRLRETLPIDTAAKAWTAREAALWWQEIAQRYSAQRANNMLMLVKRACRTMVEQGTRMDNPSKDLVRMRIPKKDLTIPSCEDIEEIIQSVRSQKKARSDEAANFIAFLAFAGCRASQAKSLRWEDIQTEWVTFPSRIEKVRVKGTKGADGRRLPMTAPLAALLETIRPPEATGPLFQMAAPTSALKNACERLGMPHLRIHDLRHFFASYALESGVDVPTVAAWLGHKDGGVLVLKTYSHVRDEHSITSAKKIVWPTKELPRPA